MALPSQSLRLQLPHCGGTKLWDRNQSRATPWTGSILSIWYQSIIQSIIQSINQSINRTIYNHYVENAQAVHIFKLPICHRHRHDDLSYRSGHIPPRGARIWCNGVGRTDSTHKCRPIQKRCRSSCPSFDTRKLRYIPYLPNVVRRE